jgi:hypothetical protein
MRSKLTPLQKIQADLATVTGDDFRPLFSHLQRIALGIVVGDEAPTYGEQMQAAKIILEYVAGKPAQALTVEATIAPAQVNFENLSQGERDALEVVMRKALSAGASEGGV